MLYPRGSAAGTRCVSLFLDSSPEDGQFPLDDVEFTLLLHGHGTPDVQKSALLPLLVVRLPSKLTCSLSLKPPLHHGAARLVWGIRGARIETH